MNSLIMEYQNNFADNFSEIAYAKIIENISDSKFFYVNNPIKRYKFEREMSNFELDFKFLSTNQVKSLTNKSYNFTRNILKSNKIIKEIKKTYIKNNILDINHYDISDIAEIPKDLIKQFQFNNTDFLVNYDILDEINSSNSIGLFIDIADMNEINYKFILNASKRLNKYLKKPILYIFCKKRPNFDFSLIPMKTCLVSVFDWREEFYMLTSCKNKIIISDKNSYSKCFWSSILNAKTYLVAFNKNLKPKNYPETWLPI